MYERRVWWRVDDLEVWLRLSWRDPGSTVGELQAAAAAVGVAVPRVWWVDGRQVDPSRQLVEAMPHRTAFLADGPGAVPTAAVVHRAARVNQPEPELTIEAEALPARPTRPGTPSWLALAAPVGMALLLAMLFSPLVLVFGLFGAALGVVRWWDVRRGFRRDLREHDALRSQREARIAHRLGEVREEHRRSMAMVFPGVTEAMRAIEARSGIVWSRRLGDDHPLPA